MLLNAFNILNKSLKEKSIELQKLNSELEIKVENRTNKLKTAYKKMKDLASIDDLTKIYNRYYFFNIFNQQLEKLKSDKTIFIFLNEHDRRRDPLKLTLKNVLLEKRTLEEIDLARRLFEYLRFSMCLL